jgi:hypothetical protein
MKGSNKNVWYTLTDVDDPNVAAELGLNFSAKLTFASDAARTANLAADGTLVFDKGTVDFSPVRNIVPGPPGAEFPPLSAQPGSVGDKDYSPFVQVVNAGGAIYNAPIVAFDVDANQINFPDGNVDYRKVHDEVVAIDPSDQSVTINLINGFSFGRPVWYISMDTSIPLGAAIEHNTFAPLMQQLHLGGDDSFSSSVERIFISTNGAESGGCDNPQRQVCRQTWLMVTVRTMSLGESPRSRWITARLGTLNCSNGLKMRSRMASVVKYAKNSRS